jgi:hypothetical protein
MAANACRNHWIPRPRLRLQVLVRGQMHWHQIPRVCWKLPLAVE